MAKTIARREIGKLLGLAVLLDITLRAAQHVTPGGEAANDQALLGVALIVALIATLLLKKAEHLDVGGTH
jgi:hypothetical protein